MREPRRPATPSLPTPPENAAILANLAFHADTPFLGDSWSHYALHGFVANDGAFSVAANGTAILDIVPYSKWVGLNPIPELDNIKFEAFSNDPVSLTGNGNGTIASFEWAARAECFGTDKSPYPPALLQGKTDLRLAAASFSLFDPDTANSFQFLLTNDRVYVVYERISIKRAHLGDYAVYTYVKAVKERSPSDWHTLKMVLDSAKQDVSWHVDGQQVFHVDHVGHRLPKLEPIIDMGGRDTEAFPASIQYGFGAQTLLNAYKPNPHVVQPPPSNHTFLRHALVENVSRDSPIQQVDPVSRVSLKPAAFFEEAHPDRPEFRTWGQGSRSHIQQIRVLVEEAKP